MRFIVLLIALAGLIQNYQVFLLREDIKFLKAWCVVKKIRADRIEKNIEYLYNKCSETK